MNADNAMHVVLPFVDAGSAKTAFPVAQSIARTLGARLEVLSPEAQLVASDELVRQTGLPADAQVLPEQFAIETAGGDLVEATMLRAAAARQALVILALRLHGDAPQGRPQEIDAVGHRLLENSTFPILIVPPERDMRSWQLRRELLPQDGTPSCAATLAQFVRRSCRMGVESLVLRVAGAHIGQPTEPGSLPTPRYVDHPQYEWEAWGREFLERVYGINGNLDVAPPRMRLLMANGDPAAEILRVAAENDVDLIILPWHGVFESGRARMVKAVLREAACPVLLLPQRGERRRFGH